MHGHARIECLKEELILATDKQLQTVSYSYHHNWVKTNASKMYKILSLLWPMLT